jgi:hypothetical protein
MAKKLKFGTYTITAEVTFEDEIDLEDHFTKEEWDKKSGTDQANWLTEMAESGAIGDMDCSFKINN